MGNTNLWAAHIRQAFPPGKPGAGLQAASHKPQASSAKLLKVQAASFKRQAASLKLQAASGKLQNLVSFIKFHAARGEGLYSTVKKK
jgi:hypothetical protein